MMSDEHISALVRAPSESINCELKRWLDLRAEVDRAKIAKALIALRNANGGSLVFGVDDKKLLPYPDASETLRQQYHGDVFQEIVKEYCLPPFDVQTRVVPVDDAEHVVVLVSGGVKAPVLARKDAKSSDTGRDKLIIRRHAVYVRSVHEGRVHSAEPSSAADWDQLVQICFDNREADIGRFLQRHAPALVKAFQGAATGLNSSAADYVQPDRTFVVNESRGPTLSPVLSFGRECFEKRLASLDPSVAADIKSRRGWREVAVSVTGELLGIPNASLLDGLFLHHPRLTGWPAWIDSRGFKDQMSHPYPNLGGWEALVVHQYLDGGGKTIDFWRIDTNGGLYLRTTFEDDVAARLDTHHGKLLDFLLVIARAAEALGTAHVFAKLISADVDEASLEAEFFWSGLAGRRLTSWVEPARSVSSVPAYQSEARSHVRVPLRISHSALAQSVVSVVEPVFETFGVAIPEGVVVEIASRTLARI